MSVAYAVRTHCKKLAKLGAYFRRDFNSSKCKTWARMTTARIKLMRNKRETVVRQMRRDVALLLQSGQDATARIRVEHVIREQNMMAANEILELFCERLVTRLSIVAKQRDCPSDLKEAISSLIFAGPRCSDIPELLAIRDIFQKKYGKDFVDAATDLRPDSGVEHVIREQNMMAANEILELFCERLVTRLSIVAKQRDCPSDLKEAISSLIFAGPRCSDIPELLAIRDIFQKKYGKDFVDAATDLRPDSGVNRLLIEKLSALNPPGELKLKVMKEIAKEYQVEWDTTETETELLKPPEERIEGPRKFVSAGSLPLNSGRAPPSAEAQKPTTRLSSGGGNEMGSANYQDAASAAKAAADSAKDAVAAAQAAAQLAQTSYDINTRSNQSPPHHVNQEGNLGTQRREYRSFSLGGAANNCYSNTDMNSDDMDFNVVRRHSYNVRRTHTDIKFDESDCDEDIEMEQQPPSGMHGKPGTPSIHPKLPDYDALSARFEALKYRKT